MGDERGFDDQFDDGLFAATLHTSRRERPHMWPKSASEMRPHTVYSEQRMSDGYGDGDWHSNYMLRRGPVPAYGAQGGAPAAAARPAFWQDNGYLNDGRPGRDCGRGPYSQPSWAPYGTY